MLIVHASQHMGTKCVRLEADAGALLSLDSVNASIQGSSTATSNTMWKFTLQAISTRSNKTTATGIPSSILHHCLPEIMRHMHEDAHSLYFRFISYLQRRCLASHPNVVLNRTFIVDLAPVKVSYWPIDPGLQPYRGSPLTCILYCLLIDGLSRTTTSPVSRGIY